MRRTVGIAILATAALVFSACGLVKRAAVAGIVALQSDVVLTQSTFVEERHSSPCGQTDVAQTLLSVPVEAQKTVSVPRATVSALPVKPVVVPEPLLLACSDPQQARTTKRA